MNLAFKVYLKLKVDSEENVLSADESGHEETIQHMIEDALYDIDGVEIKNIKVTQNEY
mgnify:CR=1 FL=1|tara:strand:+ start:701 stop:874 length:174 start_codon:yes stop_codon:yes gene_type:complete